MNKSNNQAGSMLAMILLILAIVSLLSVAALKCSILEYRMSLYIRDSEAAYQAVEAGVNCGCQELLTLLTADYSDIEELPSSITLTDSNGVFMTGEPECQASISIAEKLSQDENTCLYTFTSQGNYGQTGYKLRVEVQYSFENYYTYVYDQEGALIGSAFWYREYLDRGKIVRQERELF